LEKADLIILSIHGFYEINDDQKLGKLLCMTINFYDKKVFKGLRDYGYGGL